MLRDAWDPDRVIAVLRGVAAVALAREQPARARLLAGAVAAARAGVAWEQGADMAAEQKLWSPEGWKRIGEEAHKRLSPEAAVAAWEEGHAMPLEQAVAYALERSGACSHGDRA